MVLGADAPGKKERTGGARSGVSIRHPDMGAKQGRKSWPKASPDTRAGHDLVSDLFRSLSDEERRQCAARCRWQEFPREAGILNRDDPDNDVLFIQSGRVRATAYSPEGRPVVFRDIGPGGIVGEYAALDDHPRSADVYALEPTRVARMSAGDFLALLESHPLCMRALLRNLTASIRHLSAKLYEVTTLNANTRIRIYLLRLARDCDAQARIVNMPRLPSQADIANLLSTQRETVSREFRRLENEGILVRHDEVLLLDTLRLDDELSLI